jgi:hypothetical protein
MPKGDGTGPAGQGLGRGRGRDACLGQDAAAALRGGRGRVAQGLGLFCRRNSTAEPSQEVASRPDRTLSGRRRPEGDDRR